MPWRVRLGSMLLAASAVALLAAPITIVRANPDLTTRAGRHALAGALALAALAILELLLALIPIPRGEKWALVAAAIPFLVVGIPVLLVDATHVPRERLWNTLAPQAFGLALGATALTLCAIGRRRPRT